MSRTTFRHPFTRCHFGIARRDTTPPVGIYSRNWGAALHDVADGVHRPFTATAMVFNLPGNDENILALIALDYGWMTAGVDSPFRAKVLKACKLDEWQLMVSLSHTHAGPNASFTSPETPGAHLIQPYLDSLAETCIEAITNARQQTQPATITYGSGHCSLAVNRDYFDEALGKTILGFNPEAESGTTVLVGRVTDDAGNPRASLVNYACHPTTLAYDNHLLSPDYIGTLREVLETTYGVPAVFLQGASGELNPRDAYQADASFADRNGRQLGHAAVSALEGLLPPGVEMRYAGMVQSGANLGTWDYCSVAAEDAQRASRVAGAVVGIELPVKPHRPIAEMREEMQRARDRVNSLPPDTPEHEVRQARVEMELATRTLWRWQAIGDDDVHGFKAWVWRLGEAVFVGVQAEAYSCFQQALRSRFPGTPVAVIGVTNGWLAYLCPREVYDRGYYEEEICPYRAGCLEEVTDAVGDQIEKMLR